MGDPLSDCSPLISAASLGKLRLVRLLVDGGAQVDGRNPKGETALLAACKALRGEPAGPETVKLLTYLLQNKADPNAQDRAGRTPLMYACMERAGARVASALLAAGADPSMEDYSGASALVYAINAQHQPTLKVLIDACRARGRDIIIIATEMGVNGGPVTRRYLNVPPSPDTSPVSCMSPSDIVLKTGSPSSPEGDNIFNFRGTSKKGGSSISSRKSSSELSPLGRCSTPPPPPPPPPRQRLLSEPWLSVHNLASLNQVYEDGVKEREAGDGQDSGEESGTEERKDGVVQRREERYGGEAYVGWPEGRLPRVSQSVLSLTEITSTQGTARRSVIGGCTWDEVTQRGSLDKLPACVSPNSELRRNTLPSVMVVPPPLHLPPLVSQSQSHLQVPVSPSKSLVFLPHPPRSSPSSRASVRLALLPRLPLASSVPSLLAPSVTSSSSCSSERRSRSRRRHSVQLEQVGGEGGTF